MNDNVVMLHTTRRGEYRDAAYVISYDRELQHWDYLFNISIAATDLNVYGNAPTVEEAVQAVQRRVDTMRNASESVHVHTQPPCDNAS